MLSNRLIVSGLLILSLVGISFYGGPVSYGFFFLMLAIPAISAIYAAAVYFRFRIYQKINAKVLVVETPVDFYFTLQNETCFAFASIRTDFFSKYSTISGFDPDTEYELFPHSGIDKQTILVCRYRGEYEVGIDHVIVRDFLKLFTFSFKNNETITVSVIPRLVILEGITAIECMSLTAPDSLTNMSEPDVLVRDYIPGDDIRMINWKLTASTFKPSVRKLTGVNTPAISIIMDSHRVGTDPDEYLPLENKILETTIALTYYYLENGVKVRIYAYESGPVCYAADTPDDFEDAYNKLSYFSFREENTSEKLFGFASEVPEIGNSSAVIFVIHEPDDAYMILKNDLEKGTATTATCLVTDKYADKTPDTVVISYDADLKEVFS